MGAQVVGAGTSTIEIEGVDELVPVDSEIMGDRIEAGTLLMACGIAGGEIELVGTRLEHLEIVAMKLCEMGMRVSPTPDGLWAQSPGRLRAVDVATLPHPGFATDFMPLAVALLAVADGSAIVTENVYDSRFEFVDELARMGADVRTEGRHAVVRGVERLSGAPVTALDVRAGAALVLAGLAADGETDRLRVRARRPGLRRPAGHAAGARRRRRTPRLTVPIRPTPGRPAAGKTCDTWRRSLHRGWTRRDSRRGRDRQSCRGPLTDRSTRRRRNGSRHPRGDRGDPSGAAERRRRHRLPAASTTTASCTSRSSAPAAPARCR